MAVKVMVTGSEGFIGKALCLELESQGYEVTRFDILNGLDVTNMNQVDGHVRGNSVVFHLACKNIIQSVKNPFDDFKTNVAGTFNVLTSCVKFGVKRFVYASSASVYGNARHLPICEDDEINILSPYAAGKASGEHYCTAFNECYGLRTVILRYSNVYGGKSVGVISKFQDALASGSGIEIHGDGYQTRDYTHVKDVVDATILASMSVSGSVINIGTGVETSVLEIANMMGLGGRVTFVQRRDIDNVRRRVMNIERARKLLGWTPSIFLKDGIK